MKYICKIGRKYCWHNMTSYKRANVMKCHGNAIAKHVYRYWYTRRLFLGGGSLNLFMSDPPIVLLRQSKSIILKLVVEDPLLKFTRAITSYTTNTWKNAALFTYSSIVLYSIHTCKLIKMKCSSFETVLNRLAPWPTKFFY